MKTSQLIRSAVANHLKLLDEPIKEIGKVHHICWAIILQSGGKIPSTLPVELAKLPQKTRELCLLISAETEFISQVIESENDEINRQHQRAMYAEFLALYFEDLGD